MGKPKPQPRKWAITPLDVTKAKKVLNQCKPPVTTDEATMLYITLYDTFWEMFEKFEQAAIRVPKLENQVVYWKKKALKAKPRITPLKYD